MEPACSFIYHILRDNNVSEMYSLQKQFDVK